MRKLIDFLFFKKEHRGAMMSLQSSCLQRIATVPSEAFPEPHGGRIVISSALRVFRYNDSFNRLSITSGLSLSLCSIRALIIAVTFDSAVIRYLRTDDVLNQPFD